MPTTIKYLGQTYPIATKDELIEFANKARAAGAAQLIDELIPSWPQSRNHCLLAHAMNFECTIGVESLNKEKITCAALGRVQTVDGNIWVMRVAYSKMDDKQAKTVFGALGIPYVRWCGSWYGYLPEHIGNVAKFFDLGIAFQEFNQLVI